MPIQLNVTEKNILEIVGWPQFYHGLTFQSAGFAWVRNFCEVFGRLSPHKNNEYQSFIFTLDSWDDSLMDKLA